MSRMGLEVLGERHWPTTFPMRDPDSFKRSGFWSELDECVMSEGEQSSLSSMQANADYLKEVFKRKILDHEATFRKQVYELHRLYMVQQRLMKDLRRKGLQTWPTDMRRNPESSENAADVVPRSSSLKVGLTPKDFGKTARECDGSYLKVDERPSVNLQLPADEYIGNSSAESLTDGFKSKEFLGAKSGPDANESTDLEAKTGEICGSHGQTVFGPTFSGRTRTLQGPKSFDLNDECHEDSSSIDTSVNKNKSTSYRGLPVDLNESLSGESVFVSEDPSSVFTSAAAGSSDSYEHLHLHYRNLQASEQSPNLQKRVCNSSVEELDYIAAKSESQRGEGKGYPQRSVIGVGVKPSFEGYSSEVGVDNQIQNLSLEQLNEIQHGNSQSNISCINVSNQTETHVYSSVGSTQLPQTKRALVPGETHSERSEEDTVSSFQPRRHVVLETISGSSNNQLAGHGNGFHLRDESSDDCLCVAKDLHSARHKMEQENSRFSEKSRNCQPEPRLTATNLDEQVQVVETFDHAHLQEEMCSCSPLDCREHNEQRQEELLEIDSTVRRAAESLLYISQENSATHLSSIADAGRLEMESARECQEPEYSCDSYESIALMQVESSPQEYLPLGEPGKEKLTEKTTCVGVSKLRRGMRTRDFRRDVLPGLASLSRHEICEDLHTINEVIQSSKTRSRPRRENWGMITRSRRSRVY